MSDRGMTEHVPPTSGRRLAGLLAATLLLVLTANGAAIVYLQDNTTNRGYWLITEKWRLLEQLSEPIDTLILGDSTCNQGIDPALLDAALGGRSLNLCTIGDLVTIDDAAMLEVYLDRFPPPARVIVGHVYDSWHRAVSRPLLARIPDRGRVRGAQLLGLQWWEVMALYGTRYLPLYSENTTLATLLTRPWRLRRVDFVLDGQGFMRVEQARLRTVARNTQRHVEFLEHSGPFFISVDALLGLERLAQLADAHDLPVVLINGPAVSGLAEHESFQAYLGQVDRALSVFAEAHSQVFYVPGAQVFPADQMTSADHLTAEGSSAYTRAVVDALRRLVLGTAEGNR